MTNDTPDDSPPLPSAQEPRPHSLGAMARFFADLGEAIRIAFLVPAELPPPKHPRLERAVLWPRGRMYPAPRRWTAALAVIILMYHWLIEDTHWDGQVAMWIFSALTWVVLITAITSWCLERFTAIGGCSRSCSPPYRHTFRRGCALRSRTYLMPEDE